MRLCPLWQWRFLLPLPYPAFAILFGVCKVTDGSIFISDAERQYAPPADESRTAHARTLAAITSRKALTTQALAARKRAALRRHEDATLRLNRLDTLAAAGDPVGVKLLAVML